MSRVMRLEEIPRTYGKNAVWIECRVKGFRPYVALYKYEDAGRYVFVVSTIPDKVYLDKQRYGIAWRAWNRRPDAMEVLIEPWEGEYDEESTVYHR